MVTEKPEIATKMEKKLLEWNATLPYYGRVANWRPNRHDWKWPKENVGSNFPINSNITDVSNAFIYPNPFDNNLFLENLKNVSNLKIYTILGQLIYSKSLNGQDELNINTSHFSRGIYILSLQTEKSTISCMIVKLVI